MRAVTSESLAVRLSKSDQFQVVKKEVIVSGFIDQPRSVRNVTNVAGVWIHFAMSIVTIIDAENIPNHFLSTTSLRNILSFGKISASGRINITKTTAYQVSRNKIL